MTAMRQINCLLSLALCAGVSLPAAQFKIGAHTFTLPDGFEIELVAGPDLVPRPIEADFDEQGRLYVTDSSGSNDKVQKQLEDKPHRVVRLKDTDGDGRFDKSITFADRMMFPEGAMWLDGSLYVSAPPSIWKLTDTNNDGVADVRVEWYQGRTLGGCANDLHGPYAGPDGWIYWCKGGFVKQTNTLWNGKEFISRASHIYRARPDGTGLEPVMTGGMDNPVGLTFTAEGERIISGTFFQHPAGGKRDGLIHALYGGVYGKENDVLEGHPRTGDLLPMMTHLGAAAPAGLMRYESDVFGKGFQNNLFVACFNMHKIVRCIMEPSGATYKTTDSDFLVSDNTDFHPTDIFEDADGSLLVIDTGGWYKLCCPTSQLHKPDVLGGIYRVRRSGSKKVKAPDSMIAINTMTTDLLLQTIADSFLPRRNAALAELAKRGERDIAILQRALQDRSAGVRRQTIWALTRVNSSQARVLVRKALMDRDESVRLSAIHSTSLWRDVGALRDLRTLLLSGNAPIRRAAAEALGRLGQENASAALLSAVSPVKGGTVLDRALEHSITYGLIEIDDASNTAHGLQANDAATRRVSLIALDQMPGANLKPEQVMPSLKVKDAGLRSTAIGVVTHHPEWGESMVEYFAPLLRKRELSEAEQAELVKDLAALARVPAVQAIMASTLEDYKAADVGWFIVMRAMAASGVSQTPKAWSDALAKILWSDNTVVIAGGVNAAKSLPAKGRTNELDQRLLRIANTGFPAEVRLNALAAMSRGLTEVNSSIFDFLHVRVQATNAVATRGAASMVLAKAKLSETQLLALAEDLQFAGPIELPKLLGAFDHTTNENVGLMVVASLEKSKSIAALRADMVKPHITNFPAVVQQKADALLASLNSDAAQQKKHIDELLASAKSGDVRHGQALFNSTKAACSSCHAIGYLGGNVGPDLTRIGQVRNERDLLEAIVYPNASFVRSYEPVIVSTKDGEEVSGVLRKDAADEVVLATGPTTEQRIARSDVVEMRPGSVSVMPSGLADQFSKQEVADLLAFLKATRW